MKPAEAQGVCAVCVVELADECFHSAVMVQRTLVVMWLTAAQRTALVWMQVLVS